MLVKWNEKEFWNLEGEVEGCLDTRKQTKDKKVSNHQTEENKITSGS